MVNVGRSLESKIGGVCTATNHRVNFKQETNLDVEGRLLGPRYSYLAFQTILRARSTEVHVSILSSGRPQNVNVNI